MGEILNDTPNIFNKLQYHCWYKYLGDRFMPMLINTAYDNIHFKN